MRRRIDHPRASDGFSIIEMLVVLAMLAIVLASALPGLARYTRHDRVRIGAEDFKSICMETREKALTTRSPHRVTYDPATRGYFVERFSEGSWSVTSTDTLFAPGGVSMSGEGGGSGSNHEITFEPFGTVATDDAPAIVRFFNTEDDTSTVSIVRTGRITVRHN